MESAAAIQETLEAVFTRIEKERMADIPVLNTALSVEAVGFRQHGDDWLGVLITPWFMNLMLLPGDASEHESQPSGDTSAIDLPAGRIEFIAGAEDGIGEYRMCSLFSPVFEFGDQATAVETAELVLEGLFEIEEDTPPAAAPRRLSRRELFSGLAGAE
jgi:[NiFe] hydrogenase assembly HybE family chaperone